MAYPAPNHRTEPDNSDLTLRETIHAGQKTIWDELVDDTLNLPPGLRRYTAGFLSHVGLMSDDALIRVGRHVRKTAERAQSSGNSASVLACEALLAALTDEWLRRHPRPCSSVAPTDSAPRP